jgi:hypothetical protein
MPLSSLPTYNIRTCTRGWATFITQHSLDSPRCCEGGGSKGNKSEHVFLHAHGGLSGPASGAMGAHGEPLEHTRRYWNGCHCCAAHAGGMPPPMPATMYAPGTIM